MKTRRLNKYVVGKQLTNTTKPTNNSMALAILQATYQVIIGTLAQVQAGIATTNDPQGAINSAAAGSQILWLNGTYTTNLTISAKSGVKMVAQGHGVNLVGNISLTGVTYMDWSSFRVQGNFSADATSNGNFIRMWQASGFSQSDLGVNDIVILGE